MLFAAVVIVLSALSAGCSYGAGTQGSTRTTVPTEAFPTALRRALTDVRRTVAFPVMAPTYLPPGRPPYISVQEDATRWKYEVNLFRTAKELPLDSEAIGQPPNSGLANVLGGFGGAGYADRAQAAAELVRAAGGFVAPPPGGGLPRALAGGITAEVWAIGPGLGAVLWHQDGWQIEVNQPPPAALLTYARALSSYLARHPLPRGPGTMVVMAAGDGDHTWLAFRRGRDVYSAWDYHSARGAAAMASSMQAYSR